MRPDTRTARGRWRARLAGAAVALALCLSAACTDTNIREIGRDVFSDTTVEPYDPAMPEPELDDRPVSLLERLAGPICLQS